MQCIMSQLQCALTTCVCCRGGQIWHKTCFKCWECGMTLNMKNYKGFDKKPYCSAWVLTLRVRVSFVTTKALTRSRTARREYWLYVYVSHLWLQTLWQEAVLLGVSTDSTCTCLVCNYRGFDKKPYCSAWVPTLRVRVSFVTTNALTRSCTARREYRLYVYVSHL